MFMTWVLSLLSQLHFSGMTKMTPFCIINFHTNKNIRRFLIITLIASILKEIIQNFCQHWAFIYHISAADSWYIATGLTKPDSPIAACQVPVGLFANSLVALPSRGRPSFLRKHSLGPWCASPSRRKHFGKLSWCPQFIQDLQEPFLIDQEKKCVCLDKTKQVNALINTYQKE
jgi:hypothetical protein